MHEKSIECWLCDNFVEFLYMAFLQVDILLVLVVEVADLLTLIYMIYTLYQDVAANVAMLKFLCCGCNYEDTETEYMNTLAQ